VPMDANYPWICEFVTALLETDPKKLQDRIADAHGAIARRLAGAKAIDTVELTKIADAQNALFNLGKELTELLPVEWSSLGSRSR
jgi:hypothetical protein